jgi:PAS domain S-box-containing protein
VSNTFDEIAACDRSPYFLDTLAANVHEGARIIREETRGAGGSDPFFWAVCTSQEPIVITDPRERDNPIVFANGAFATLTGFDRNEVLGRNCRFLHGPATNRKEVARLQAAVDSGYRIELNLLNQRKDGTSFWNRLLVSPVIGSQEDLVCFFVWQFNAMMEWQGSARIMRGRANPETVAARRDADLHAIDKRLRFALTAGGLGSWTLDPHTTEFWACEISKTIYGRPLSEPFTYEQLEASVHPDDRDRRAKSFNLAIDQGNTLDVEFRIHTSGSGERWVRVCGQMDYRADGTALLLGGVAQDITSSRRVDEHRALLADELSHRVKNTLTSLQAVVAQTMRHASSIDQAATTLGARIQAMAAANDLLVEEQFESASILDVLTRALAPFGVEDGHRFILEGADLRLPPRLVVSFALSLHELATNATKYGALSNAEGIVRISWMVATDSDMRRLHLLWTEKQGPLVELPTKTSFGTRLLQRVLEREIGGTVELSFLPEGFCFKAVAPLSETA